jgi:hypothetical protein
MGAKLGDFKGYFPRTTLAQEYLNVFEDSESRAITLFGPRGIGKTSLLHNDLIPLAVKSARVPVYIDLWSARSDPGAVIADRLRAETQKLWGAIKGKKEISGASIGIGGVSVGAQVSRPAVQEPEGAERRITFWMSQLADAAGKRKILLLLDEVQSLGRAANGVDIAASLRAGMQTNFGRYEAVFTGSSRDQLAAMFKDLRAPLWNYGDEQLFPPLGKEFSDELSRRFEEVTGRAIDPEQVWRAFQAVGFNPQTLSGIVRTMAIDGRTRIDDEDIEKLAAAHIALDREIKFNALPPLERAILVTVSAKAQPFGADAIRYYTEVTGATVTTSAVQKALTRLRNESVLYQKAGGEYAVDSPLLVEWLTQGRPQALGYVLPFIPSPAFEEAVAEGEYTGPITAIDAARVLQDVGEGRVLSHRRASKRHGDDALLKPGRIARIRYSAGSWDVSDPNVRTPGGGRKRRGRS